VRFSARELWGQQGDPLALKLSEAGHFSWTEWGEHFGAYLRRAAAADGSANGFVQVERD
jgi:hypothetical protein